MGSPDPIEARGRPHARAVPAPSSGELIDSNHATMQALASELGLALDDLVEPSGIRPDTFYFDHVVQAGADVVAAFETIAPALADALVAADSDEVEYAISIRDFLADISGASELVRSILGVAYTGEYGRKIEEQSCLDLVHLMDSETTDPFRIFGDSNERYHLDDGSESIAAAFTEQLAGRIELERRLVAIRRDGERIRWVLDRAGTAHEESFDHVVLTLPFTMLRDVEIDARVRAASSPEQATIGAGNRRAVRALDARPGPYVATNALVNSRRHRSSPRERQRVSVSCTGRSSVIFA